MTLIGTFSYQENIKHKSGIKFTASVLNRLRVFRHIDKCGTL